nr:MAG TPA: hypothetical protein [Caudoviricetes sp.]
MAQNSNSRLFSELFYTSKRSVSNSLRECKDFLTIDFWVSTFP